MQHMINWTAILALWSTFGVITVVRWRWRQPKEFTLLALVAAITLGALIGPLSLIGPVLHKVRRTMRNNYIEALKAQTFYACEYTHNGELWAINIFAVDASDAALKVESIKKNLALCGVIEVVIPWNDNPRGNNEA